MKNTYKMQLRAELIGTVELQAESEEDAFNQLRGYTHSDKFSPNGMKLMQVNAAIIKDTLEFEKVWP